MFQTDLKNRLPLLKARLSVHPQALNSVPLKLTNFSTRALRNLVFCLVVSCATSGTLQAAVPLEDDAGPPVANDTRPPVLDAPRPPGPEKTRTTKPASPPKQVSAKQTASPTGSNQSRFIYNCSSSKPQRIVRPTKTEIRPNLEPSNTIIPSLIPDRPDNGMKASSEDVVQDEKPSYEQAAEARLGVVTRQVGSVQEIIRVDNDTPAMNIIYPNGARGYFEKGYKIIRVNGVKADKRDAYLDVLSIAEDLTLIVEEPPHGVVTIKARLQAPKVFRSDSSNGLSLSSGRPSLGVRVASHPDGGIKIVQVEANSPATKMMNSAGRQVSLANDDIISMINGEVVRNVADFNRLINQTNGEFWIEIKNTNGKSRLKSLGLQ